MRRGTDLTGTWRLQDGSVSVLLTVEHHTAEFLGIHAAKRATRWEALEPVLQAVRRSFGGIVEQIAAGVELRSSQAFVRAPEGNGCAERAIRTLKEQLLWVKTFETVEELRLALLRWAELYNEQWLIERHGFKSPAQRRREHYANFDRLAACESSLLTALCPVNP